MFYYVSCRSTTNVKMKADTDCFHYIFTIYSSSLTSVHCSFPLFFLSPSPLLPRSYCTSCPSSPRKMISISCSNILEARRAWWMKKEHTQRPLLGSAHAVSGSLELYSADVWTACFCHKKHFWNTVIQHY